MTAITSQTLSGVQTSTRVLALTAFSIWRRIGVRDRVRALRDHAQRGTRHAPLVGLSLPLEHFPDPMIRTMLSVLSLRVFQYRYSESLSLENALERYLHTKNALVPCFDVESGIAT